MQRTIKYTLFFAAFLSITAWGPFGFLFHSKNKEPFGTEAWVNKEIDIIRTQADNIPMGVLRLGLKAFLRAHQQGYDEKGLLTIIDYTKPSTQRRLWVININEDEVLYNTWVTHGKNSGKLYATSFSNRLASLQSSYGVFATTDKPYVGGNGYSLRLVGLEQGINDNAYKRDIVFHGAWYADPDVARKYGQLGRSWGCPAVSDSLAKPIIDTIKNGTIVFAYTDNQNWIKHSPYLNG